MLIIIRVTWADGYLAWIRFWLLETEVVMVVCCQRFDSGNDGFCSRPDYLVLLFDAGSN